MIILFVFPFKAVWKPAPWWTESASWRLPSAQRLSSLIPIQKYSSQVILLCVILHFMVCVYILISNVYLIQILGKSEEWLVRAKQNIPQFLSLNSTVERLPRKYSEFVLSDPSKLGTKKLWINRLYNTAV